MDENPNTSSDPTTQNQKQSIDPTIGLSIEEGLPGNSIEPNHEKAARADTHALGPPPAPAFVLFTLFSALLRRPAGPGA